MSSTLRSLLGAICCLTLGVVHLIAQPNRDNRSSVNWFFGNNAGLTFINGAPEVLTGGQVNTLDGSAVASDPVTGSLLFYTDGITVWDSTHSPMPNGTGLLGHESSGQPALIVPMPGESYLFYVFTTGAANTPNTSTRYSVVDMRVNGGRGDVIEKNNLLIANGTEKITATRHCNGRDYWIVAHEWGSNKFYSYLISPGGIGTPIVSGIGVSYPTSGDVQGTFQVSSNGRTLAASSPALTTLELFDFNNATGDISNQRLLASGDRHYYGLEFSPDNTKLYVNTLPFRSDPAHLYQFNLSAGGLAAIQTSRYQLREVQGNWQGGQLQLAPDGKVYISWFGRDSLAVIGNPNAAAPACAYDHNGFYLGGKRTKYGLPNVIDSDMPGVMTGFVALNLSVAVDKTQVEVGETILCRIVVCNDASNDVRSLSISVDLPVELTNLDPPQGGGSYLIDSIPAAGCDTLTVRLRAGQGDGLVSFCVGLVGVAPSSVCLILDSSCADVALVARPDTEAVDYTYHLPSGCVGTVDQISVLFHSRRHTDTITEIAFEGNQGQYFAYDGERPIRFVIRPTSDQWLPITIRRPAPGPVSAVMKVTTVSGDVFRIRLVTAVKQSMTPILDLGAILVRERSGSFDTCITATNTSGFGIVVIDTVWLRGLGNSRVHLTAPTLPIFLGKGGSATICFSITDPSPALNDTLILGAQEAADFCPHCAYQVIAIRGVAAGGSLSGVESKNGTETTLRLIPNPLKDVGVIELSLVKEEYLRLSIINEVGGEVLSIAERKLFPAGRSIVPVDATMLPSGHYRIVFEGEHGRGTQVIQVVR